MIILYEKMLAENAGTTIKQEGYGGGGAFNAIAEENASSLSESIVTYAKRTAAAEAQVIELKSCLGVLEMNPTRAQDMAMFMAPLPTTTYRQNPLFQNPPLDCSPYYSPLMPPQTAFWTL